MEKKGGPGGGAGCGRRQRFGDFGAAVLLALLLSLLLGPAGCASESSTLGQYHKGRTLHVSVVSLEQAAELRYSTIDPNGVLRHWSLSASRPGQELVLARLRVENHTAVSAIVNVDRAAAELRDFANATYNPVSVDERVWQDFRGEPEAVVRVNLGQCFDGNRALIDPGTAVRWQSEAATAQYIAFDDAAVDVGPGGRAELSAGGSLSHTFRQPGNYPYVCGDLDGTEQVAEIQVAAAEQADFVVRTVVFLQGAFTLPRGNGVDGYMIFEAPAGTEFRDFRWRAGDSITIRF